MGARWAVIGLFASLALNLFLIGAAAGVIALGARMAKEGGSPAGALVVATRNLPQSDRRAFRQMLLAERTEIAADTAKSRQLRLAAWIAIAEANPDAAAIKSELAQSRQFDIGVRTKVEEKIVDYVAALPQKDRAIFADGMRRALTPPPRIPAPAPPSNSAG